MASGPYLSAAQLSALQSTTCTSKRLVNVIYDSFGPNIVRPSAATFQCFGPPLFSTGGSPSGSSSPSWVAQLNRVVCTFSATALASTTIYVACSAVTTSNFLNNQDSSIIGMVTIPHDKAGTEYTIDLSFERPSIVGVNTSQLEDISFTFMTWNADKHMVPADAWIAMDKQLIVEMAFQRTNLMTFT